jgi:N-acetylglucosamine-6-phosphate deacetylase
MKPFCIHAARFVLPGSVAGPGYLAISDGVFGTWSAEAPEGLEVVERAGCWVTPGFVDIHIHGFAGHDVMDCDAAGIDAISLALARHGTTSWTPTTLTQPAEQIEAACASVYEAETGRDEGFPGARVEGILLEGPFFTKEHGGAQNPANMLDPDVDLFCRWQEAAHGLICRSALAPERAGSERYCAELHAMGVVTALGHSDATCEQGLAAVAAGATCFIHTYNGMSGHHHRDGGLVTCALTSVGTTCELICDGIHVSPAGVRTLLAARGWEHVAVISDCLRCGGMPDGDYTLGDFPVRTKDGAALLVNPDGSLGNLAGSIATLAGEVRNLVSWGVVTPEQAIRMASEVPARASAIDDCCGQILPGRAADLNVLGPDLELRETYIGGRRVPGPSGN